MGHFCGEAPQIWKMVPFEVRVRLGVVNCDYRLLIRCLYEEIRAFWERGRGGGGGGEGGRLGEVVRYVVGEVAGREGGGGAVYEVLLRLGAVLDSYFFECFLLFLIENGQMRRVKGVVEGLERKWGGEGEEMELWGWKGEEELGEVIERVNEMVPLWMWGWVELCPGVRERCVSPLYSLPTVRTFFGGRERCGVVR